MVLTSLVLVTFVSSDNNGKFLFYPIFSLLMLGLVPLLRKGGKPIRRDGATLFPSRPGIRITYGFLIALGVICGCMAYRERNSSFWLESCLCLCAMTGGAFGLSMSYTLDAEGMHYRRFGKTTTILWDDLDHFERFHDARYNTKVIFFRSTAGTTINVSDIGIDADKFLRIVKLTKQVPEMPYKRKHWLGG